MYGRERDKEKGTGFEAGEGRHWPESSFEVAGVAMADISVRPYWLGYIETGRIPRLDTRKLDTLGIQRQDQGAGILQIGGDQLLKLHNCVKYERQLQYNPSSRPKKEQSLLVAGREWVQGRMLGKGGFGLVYLNALELVTENSILGTWNIRSHYKKGAFAAAVSCLGIENKNDLVVYDGKGIYSAARVRKDADPGEDNQHTSSKDVESHGRAKGGSVLHVSII
ncbi:unnamed protein product, partial [Prunus brigantina]